MAQTKNGQPTNDIKLGYDQMNRRGEELENCQDDNQLILIKKPADAPTFYFRVWHTTSAPDLAFHSPDMEWNITRVVGDQFRGSDHRPILLVVQNEGVREKSTLFNVCIPLNRECRMQNLVFVEAEAQVLVHENSSENDVVIYTDGSVVRYVQSSSSSEWTNGA
jgi:hypothetical protein